MDIGYIVIRDHKGAGVVLTVSLQVDTELFLPEVRVPSNGNRLIDFEK
jgi:hypothetical protein